MENSLFNVEQITDVEELHLLKEKIKNQVVDPTICWQARMNLYSKVRAINERILQLETPHTHSSLTQ